MKMKRQEHNSNKQTKFLAIIMIITGSFIWFFSGSDKVIIQDLIIGVGIFLLIVGIVIISSIKNI